jgi:glycosyltransferase involved in cell wall biosynthesis
VSVVIPTHLADPPYLGEALASLVGQEWANWEAIVVDDGSPAAPGALEDLVGIDPRVSLVRAPKGGLSRARNLALEQARGELVAYLDSDDYWYPHHLSLAVAALAGHDEAIGVYSVIAQVRGNDKEPFEVNRQSGPVNRRTALSGGNRPFINALVARRHAVEAAGGFDPQFDGAEDKDLIYRLLEKGPCLRLDDVTVAYRAHANNVSADPVRSFKVDARVLAAHRARALRAGDTEAAADIAVGLRLLRRYTAGACVAGALAAAKSGRVKRAVALGLWSLRCSPAEAARAAGRRGRERLLRLRRPAPPRPPEPEGRGWPA